MIRKHRWISKFLSVVLIANLMINTNIIVANDLETNPVYYQKVEREHIASGITYEKKTLFTESGWVDMHVLLVDLENEYVDLDILRSDKYWGHKDQLTDLAKSSDNIVAGINGSFFGINADPSDAIGPEYEGQYISFVNGYDTEELGITSFIEKGSQQMMIDFFQAQMELENEKGEKLYIHGVNRLTDFSFPVIFDHKAIQNTSELIGENLYKVFVENDVVKKILLPSENIDLRDDSYVVVMNGNIAPVHYPYFEIGKKLKLSISNNVGDDDLELLISGGGKILENGEYVEPLFVPYPNNRHPRTAIGITEDSKEIVAMVVDGRGASIGATHVEMAAYMLEYKVKDAMHFDGGGSSTLVAKKNGEKEVSVYNTPSDRSERRVVNGLGFISSAPEGVLNRIKLVGNRNRVMINEPIEFNVLGYDKSFNYVEVDNRNLAFSSKGLDGYFEDGKFIPTAASKGTITCYYDNVFSTISVEVIDEFIDIDIEPRILELDKGQEEEFNITLIDKDGYKHSIQSSDVSYQLVDESIGAFEEGVFKPAVSSGISKVNVSYNKNVIDGYIVVGSEKVKIESFENLEFEPLVYPVGIKGEVVETKALAYDEETAIELKYDFEPSESSQALYAVFAENELVIQKTTDELGLNVYGDNSNLMMKGRIKDSEENSYAITFSNKIDWQGWQYVEATLPKGITYPISVERIYVATLASEQASKGSLYFDLLNVKKDHDVSWIKFDNQEHIKDPMMVSFEKEDMFNISVFGASGGRNRLLDEIVMNKVYASMNEADLAIYTGDTDIDEIKINNLYSSYDNTYRVVDYADVRMIYLATDKNGMMATDPTQWNKISNDLVNTAQKNIIIVGSKNPLYKEDFIDEREGELLHETLRDFKVKSSKNIFYINASGYNYNVKVIEGIRYIDINGLWYTVNDDKKLNLNRSFYVLDFYIDHNNLYYRVENLYPSIEVDN